jgi:hypothetical protein
MPDSALLLQSSPPGLKKRLVCPVLPDFLVPHNR